jgi:LacI family transcriptional regulator
MSTDAKSGRNTIAEVADRAHVSPTTVSHVLSGNRPVADATRERVRQAIEELGYRPSGLARSLRLQRSETIALIVPDIANPFYPALARGVDDELDGRYLTFLCNTDGQRERELRFAADARDRKVDGLILAAFGVTDEDTTTLLEDGVPVVLLGQRLHGARADCVFTDDEHGGHEATRHLLERGHRRIGLISGREGPEGLRTTGHHRALEEAGLEIDPSLQVVGDWHRAGGAAAMRKLIELSERPTAVFAENDLMAIGALDAAREGNLLVPGDLAIVGFDDIEAAQMTTPPLTTVINPAYEVGRQAARLLLDRMTGNYEGGARVVALRSELVIRQSS